MPLQVLGAVVLVASVAVGTWAVGKMGWARLLFAGALFPPGAGAEENNVPQRLVVEGPYRYVRNPLYVTDSCLIVGAALVTSNRGLVLLAALYAAQLALQLPLEERELRGVSAARTAVTASSCPVSSRARRPSGSEILAEDGRSSAKERFRPCAGCGGRVPRGQRESHDGLHRVVCCAAAPRNPSTPAWAAAHASP